MTREEAVTLRVGTDKIFVVEPKLEEIYEASVTGIELESCSRLNSPIKVTGYCKSWSGRVYDPSEIFCTEVEAIQRLVEIHQFRADQALNKKHALVAKIAKLKKKRG